MEIATGCSKKSNEQEAVLEACNQLVQSLPSPSFIFMVATVNYNNQLILSELHRTLNAAKIMGGTSCIGLFTEKGGYCSEDHIALGLLGFDDDNGCFGIAGLSLSDNPFNDGAEVISKALKDSGRPGEIPSIILMTSAPGHEEALIEGIMSVVGTDVPIFGGSSADNSISGRWQQFCGTQIFHNGITIAVIYSSKPIGYAFHNGYMPTEHNGIITKVEGRIVRTIDGKSAADIYNQWSGGLITKSLGSDSNILAASTLNPLGRAVGMIGTIPYYNLSHPNQVFADGSMSFFTTFCENDSVVFMEGTVNSLKSRVKRVIHLAKENYSSHHLDKPKGALIIYCAGCFLALEDQIEDVVSMVYTELPFEPFLGMFTFGEQGCLFGGENRHGNLMISAIVFG